MKKPFYIVAILIALAGAAMFFCCSSGPDIAAYASKKPEFDPRKYFDGKVEASGVFIDRSGMVDPYFHIAMNGAWTKDGGKIDEEFVYSDGRKDKRTWNAKFTGEKTFTATAHDVVGEARGEFAGNAMHLNYILRVPVKGQTYDLSLSDWMYMLDAETVINRIVMRKFGFKVGELIVTFRKKHG